MRRDKRSILIVTVSATLIALIWSTGLAEAAEPVLWPLGEGQWMEFLIQSPFQVNPEKAQIRVIGSKTIEGTEYFGVEIPEWGQGTQETVFLRSTEKSLYRLEADGECTVAEIDHFGVTSRCRTGAGGWEVTTSLAQVALEVPAGVFANAHLFRKHIEYDNGSISPDWDVYIVPGFGPVKRIEYGGNFDGQSAPRVVRTIELMRVGTSLEISSEDMQSVPTIPDTKAETPSAGAEGNARGVASLGTIVEVRPSSFVLKQESLEVFPVQETVVPFIKHNLAIGYVDNHLEVLTDDATQIAIGGTLTTPSALRPGMRVVVAGMTQGDSLKATIVSDLSSVGPPPEELSQSMIESKESAVPIPYEPVTLQEEPPAGTLSMCMGQDMDYDYEPHVWEFQGCYGGPSSSDSFSGGHVAIFCPVVGCWTLHKISYTASLGGWGFDFPYRFSASPVGLTYHKPSSVSLDLEPLWATQGELTFWGGLGFNIDLDIDFSHPCIPDIWNICHDHFATVPITAFSTIHEATGPAPMPGQTLKITEAACPGIGVGIPDTPIQIVTVEICEDLSLDGAPFSAHVTAKGESDLASAYFDFDGSSQALSLTPDSHSVDVRFDDFWWVPDISMGIYFRLVLAGQTLFSTPTINIISGPFMAITTPFPYPGSVMTVATDPLSPISVREYLYQPTGDIIRIPVDPAPTRLAIISSNTLLEGEPIQALLQEDYAGAPAASQEVMFTTVVPGGQGGITVMATTGPDGIARAIFPIGEYTTLSAVFHGSSYYRASASSYSSSNLTISAAPDLTGQWQSLDRQCRYTKKGPKCKISGKLDIQNAGSLTSPKSVVRFYLSDNKVYNQGDTLLKQIALGSLGAGGSSTKALKYTIPSGGTAGGMYIIAVIDADNSVVEYKGNNHVVFGPFDVIVF